MYKKQLNCTKTTYNFYINNLQQSGSWQGNISWASQEIPRILWKPKVHYRINKSPLFIRIPSQINPVHVLPTNLFNIHFNIILSTTDMTLK
jgi:hypothetical protein